MFLNYVNSDDILGQVNVYRLIYRTSIYLTVDGIPYIDARAFTSGVCGGGKLEQLPY